MAGITTVFAARDRMTSQLQQMSRQGRNTTSVFKKMAVAVGGAFAVAKVVDFGKQTVMTFANFEQGMANVKATMGDISDVEFSKLEKAARRAGKTTKFSATQSSEALNYMAF